MPVFKLKTKDLYLPQVGNKLVEVERAFYFREGKDTVGKSFLEEFCKKSKYEPKDFDKFETD